MSKYTTLAQELRQRINPAYATQLGTESYERRLCAEAIEYLLAINAELLEAAMKVVELRDSGMTENDRVLFVDEGIDMLYAAIAKATWETK